MIGVFTPLALGFTIFGLSLQEFAQGAGVIVVLITFLAVGRTRSKDATIKTWREEAEAQEARSDRLQEELTGAQQRADREATQVRDCEKRIAHLEGELTTMERYTAQSALETVAERLASIESTIVGAISSQGELILKNTELASGIVGALERVGKDLEAIEKRNTPPSE